MVLEYLEQKTAYTCGATVMAMALRKFGIRKSEKQLVRLLKTNKVRGTWHRDMVRVVEKYNLSYIVTRDGTINDLKYFMKSKHTVIVCYYFPKEKFDHYSIIKKITSKKIYFYDPWFGPNHSYTISYFNKIWRGDPLFKTEGDRWSMAIIRR